MASEHLADLRRELEQLIAPGKPLEALAGQAEGVERLRARYPHSIRLESLGKAHDARTNCYMTALGLTTEDVRDWCEGEVYPNRTFVADLVPRLRRVDEHRGMPDGLLVVYLGPDRLPVHAGVSRRGYVVSKWGSRGANTYVHPVLEVPASYGSDVQLFRRPTSREALLTYREWAEAHGVRGS